MRNDLDPRLQRRFDRALDSVPQLQAWAPQPRRSQQLTVPLGAGAVVVVLLAALVSGNALRSYRDFTARGSPSPTASTTTGSIAPILPAAAPATCTEPAVLENTVTDLNGDGVPDCLTTTDSRDGAFMQFVDGATTNVTGLGKVAIPLSRPAAAVYRPAGELPVIVITAAVGADAGQALIYQWQAGRFTLLLTVGGKRIEQSVENGRPLLHVTSGGTARDFGWNGTTYVGR